MGGGSSITVFGHGEKEARKIKVLRDRRIRLSEGDTSNQLSNFEIFFFFFFGAALKIISNPETKKIFKRKM